MRIFAGAFSFLIILFIGLMILIGDRLSRKKEKK